MRSLEKKTVILGVGGGIAAYKTCELTRLLVQSGANVHVILTQSAAQFVTPLTLQTLSKNPVHTDLFSLAQEQTISHIALADKADVVVVAPATADLIAKAAHGLANDLLTNVLLATRAPVLFCPSMNVHMWEHKATQQNVGRLRELGYQVMEPASGELACGTIGKGRLCEPEEIIKTLQKIIGSL
ncbi:MAG: hypothetical protein A3H42_03495 [Deltaproteobacteria bacterium RIFCSPLOWO2_02_FULL_46_8]|nr:MAG: hypothetical protein A3H42_03495 [Deltaproteobacteria bacterium RIFCSPLOWO2_02_FULL_46_8]